MRLDVGATVISRACAYDDDGTAATGTPLCFPTTCSEAHTSTSRPKRKEARHRILHRSAPQTKHEYIGQDAAQ